MPEKPKDSKAGLGASIADDLGDDEEGNSNVDNTDDAAGGDDKTGGGTPKGEGEDDATGGDADKGEEKTVTLTATEMKKIVDDAVSGAVGSVNSTKDKQLEAERKAAREREERLIREGEDARLQGLSEEDRAKMRQVFENDRTKREIDQRNGESAEMYKTALTARHLTASEKFGVTETELLGCESEAEMLALCTGKERDYWQKVASGEITPDDPLDKKSKDGDRKRPAGSRRRTDTGSEGSGGGSGDAGPANTLSGFAQGLMKDGVVPGGGIEVKRGQ